MCCPDGRYRGRFCRSGPTGLNRWATSCTSIGKASERSFRFRLDALAGTAGIDPRDLGILYLNAAGHGSLCDVSRDISRTI